MFTLPKLTYNYKALEPFIDEKTMELHHGKHHKTYIEKLNEALKDHQEFLELDIVSLLKKVDALPDEIKTQVKNNGGGHANHSLFWEIMHPHDPGKLAPKGRLETAINSFFGSIDNFKEKLSNLSISHFGSGWGWLVVEGGKLEITTTPNQDSPFMEGKTPILGIDVWEHAYYLKYQNKRAEYISAWWNIVNWEKVADNFAKSEKKM